MTETRTIAVTEERTFDSSPEEIWNAWTTGEGICGWFLDELRGKVAAGERIDWVWTEFCAVQALRVEEAMPHRRLVLRPVEEGWPDGLIEITIEPAAGGASTLRLVQSGFRADAEWDEEYEGVRSGWHMALALLGEYLAGRFGKTRSAALAGRKLAYEYDALAPFYRDEASLARWLTRSGQIGDEGDNVALVLHDGSPLTGRVIARTGAEVALSWNEIDGAIELKAYGLPDSRAVAILASSWSIRDDEMKAKVPFLDGCLERLATCLG